jgi:glycerophosphoryl diester phosphodiesterase
VKRILYTGVIAMLLNVAVKAQINDKYTFVFKLHEQTRRYEVNITERKDTLLFEWSTLRNSLWQKGIYKMENQNVEEGDGLSWLQPIDGCEVALPVNETFGIISRKAFKSLKDKAWFVYNETTYRKVVGESFDKHNFRGEKLIHVLADVDQTNMWIVDNETLPLIYKVTDNPLGIDWSVE